MKISDNKVIPLLQGHRFQVTSHRLILQMEQSFKQQNKQNHASNIFGNL